MGGQGRSCRRVAPIVGLQTEARATDLAGVLGEQVSVHLPFWVAAVAVLLGVGVLTATRPHLAGIDAPDDELEEATGEASAITIGNDS
jgi:ACDE family multidrug resistance protein